MRLSFFSSFNLRAAVLLFSIACVSPTRAEAPPPPPTEAGPEAPPPEAPGGPPEELPEIEARTFKLGVVRRSQSGRVYLFDDVDSGQPRVGRILLLREGDRPVMAFRMLKGYPDKKQLAAGKIRQYDGFPALEAGQSYLAVEKVSDVMPPPPSAQDNADIRELENASDGPPLPAGNEGGAPPGSAPPFDPELDAASAPKPRAGSLDESPPEDDSAPIAVEEIHMLEPNRQWLSAGFGMLFNPFPTDAFLAGGVRYGVVLKKMVFLKRAFLQDALALETGLYLYKVLNNEGGDTYTVLPLMLNVRYSVQVGENASLFAYAGATTNLLVDAEAPSGFDQSVFESNKNALSSFKTQGDFPFIPTPAFGVGMTFAVGPNWDARVEAGIDHIGAGLVLKF